MNPHDAPSCAWYWHQTERYLGKATAAWDHDHAQTVFAQKAIKAFEEEINAAITDSDVPRLKTACRGYWTAILAHPWQETRV